MRMLGTTFESTSFGSMDTRVAGIKASAKIVFQILTGMVTDKLSYPIREYATNAWEVSPPDKPFEVDLPTPESPVFRIRDYGPGLDHDFMMNRYPVIGDSTKDDNDEAVGGWGNGSKSAFAYLIRQDGTGTYTVISRQDGVRRSYVIGLNPQGEIQVDLMEEEQDPSPSGLEVLFPVRLEDVRLFTARAGSVLWSFQPRPVITPDPEWKEPVVKASGHGWAYYEPGSVPWTGPQLIMGPVRYPLDLTQFQTRGFVNARDTVAFTAKIGSVSVSTSRETLAYDDKTKETIQALIDGYAESFTAAIQEQVDVAESYFEACDLFHKATGTLGSERRRFLRERVTWKGLQIRLEISTDSRVLKTMRLAAGWGGFSRFEHQILGPGEGTTAKVVVEHSPYRSLDRLLAAGLHGKEVLWLRVRRERAPGILASIGNPDHIVLDNVPLEKRKTGPREKMMRSRRVITFSAMRSDGNRLIDLSIGGLYLRKAVGLRRREERFHFGTIVYEKYRIEALIKDLRDMGIVEDLTVLVPKADDKLDATLWYPLDQYLEMRIMDRLDLQKVDPVANATSYNLDTGLRRLGWKTPPISLANGPKALADFQEKARAIVVRLDNRCDPADQDQRLYEILSRFARVHLPAKADPVKELNEEWELFTESHPVIEMVLANSYNWSPDPKAQKAIDSYLDLLLRAEKLAQMQSEDSDELVFEEAA